VEETVGLALLVFLTVCSSILVGHQLVTTVLSRNAARVRQRMADEFGQGADTAPSSPLYKNLEQLSLDPEMGASADRETAPPTPAPAVRDRLESWLEAAGLSWQPAHLLLGMALLALAAGAAASWFAGPIAGGIAAILAALAPLLYVRFAWQARQERYLKQLPNAFELMARVIRAGQSVPQSLQAVADAFEDPLAHEFQTCLQKQNLGMRPELAFQAMAESSGILEIRIFAMAMLIQRQSGGNLSDVLERLAGLIRARLKLRQQVRTLTAEGRMQGGTLLVLPFIVFFALLFLNRGYVEVLFQHPSLIVATLASMGVGVLWIRKIVSIN
jgi:tight adherence protein B